MATTPTEHGGTTFRVLPLSIQERNGQLTIYCNGEHCVWSWRLYNDRPEANGRTITSAVRHVHKRHPASATPCDSQSETADD